MKLALVLLLFLATPAFAQSYVNEFSDDGPFLEVEVVAPATPTPYMTGFDAATKQCILLANVSVERPVGFYDLVVRLHEAGHCHALRLGLQNIDDGTTLFGETFADVFALTWISTYMPYRLDDAYTYLMQNRLIIRNLAREYNTVFLLRRAYQQLPSAKPPLQFTVDLLTK